MTWCFSEYAARQRIHMKNQALFSSKNKVKTIKCRLLQFLFGALRVNLCIYNAVSNYFIILKVISIGPSRFLTIVYMSHENRHMSQRNWIPQTKL